MKIISYCIFGKEQYYKHGVRRNIYLAKRLFPGWTIRLYAEKDTQDDLIAEFSNINGVEVIIKTQNFPQDGVHWRMLPMEEGHDVVIVRDVDTTLIQRDVALVDDWLKSPYQYSVGRDEPGMKSVIMAGIWGAKNPCLDITSMWNRFYKKRSPINFNDLKFLDKLVYPLIRNDLVVYSEFNVYEGESCIRKIPCKLEKDDDGLYQVIGMRVFKDISDEDDNLNDVIDINLTRKMESGRGAVKWFNDRYDNSHIVIRKPRYKYNNILKNEVYWLCSNLFDKGFSYFFQVISNKSKYFSSKF